MQYEQLHKYYKHIKKEDLYREGKIRVLVDASKFKKSFIRRLPTVKSSLCMTPDTSKEISTPKLMSLIQLWEGVYLIKIFFKLNSETLEENPYLISILNGDFKQSVK